MVTIKNVDGVSLGRISGALYAFIGLIAGSMITLVSLIGTLFMSVPASATFAGLGAIIIFPIINGIMGFLLGFFGAALYNIVASRIGGIELVTE